MLTGTLRPRAQVAAGGGGQRAARRASCATRARASRPGELAGRARRDRLPPEPRAGQGGAGGGRGQPQPRARREGARRQSLLKTGGITDKDTCPRRSRCRWRRRRWRRRKAETRDRGAAARAHRDPGALRAAAWRSATPTPARCSPNGHARSSPWWTTPCSSSGPAVPSAHYGKVQVGAARRGVRSTRSPAGPVKGRVARVSPLVDERTRSFEVVVEVPGQTRRWWAASSRAPSCAWAGCRARSWCRPRRSMRDGSRAGVGADVRGERTARPSAAASRWASRRRTRSRCARASPRASRSCSTRRWRSLGRSGRAPRRTQVASRAAMFLTRISIKQPVFATMMMLALAVLGLTSYRQLNVDQFPDVEFPIVTVTTVYPGASPEAVEREVTSRSRSRSTPSRASATSSRPRRRALSNIVVIFHLEISTQVASQDIRGKVAAIRGAAAARDRGADRPAHRPQRAADRLGGGERARASRRRPRPRSPTSSSRSAWRPWPAWAP